MAADRPVCHTGEQARRAGRESGASLIVPSLLSTPRKSARNDEAHRLVALAVEDVEPARLRELHGAIEKVSVEAVSALQMTHGIGVFSGSATVASTSSGANHTG